MRPGALIVLTAALIPAAGLADSPGAAPWSYRVGTAHPRQQGNFCDDRESALEIAGIFERFGARTGFTALSSSSDCSTRVHGVTPESLLQRVRVPLDGGGEYFVSFIQVQADDGSRPVLVTTRALVEE